MKREIGEKIPPDAGSLSESLRDFGYTLQQALADLVDNSLTSEAKDIFVTISEDGNRSFIAVIDNGKGMSKDKLVEAMRMGTHGPLLQRRTNDLGRFGLGMKTASLSQGRCFTVITRQSDTSKYLIRKWDLDQMTDWQLLTEASPVALKAAELLEKWPSGTAVIIEKLDRVSFDKSHGHGLERNMANALKAVSRHLAMVFHRFISTSNVKIHVGGASLKAWDPFMREKATLLQIEKLPFAKTTVTITPYILPHHSRITEDEHEYSAGVNGWNEHQGFYIYRNERLVVPGSWLDLGLKRDEHCKLARIQVDLPNSIDGLWQLNVMKSHVSVPVGLKPDFLRIASDVRAQAADVYRYRGERQLPTRAPSERFIWKRKDTLMGIQFQIDRTHPIVQALLNSGCGHEVLLTKLLELIERSLPIANIVSEPAKSIDGAPVNLSQSQIEELVTLVNYTETFLVRHGLSPEKAREKVLMAEPFAQYRVKIISLLEAR